MTMQLRAWYPERLDPTAWVTSLLAFPAIRNVHVPEQDGPSAPNGHNNGSQDPPSALARDGRGRFARGHSGNLAGRPAGIAAMIRRLDQMAEAEGERIIEKLLAMAKAGDIGAMNIVATRLWPTRRGRPLPEFEMPPLTDATSVGEALAAIVAATASGLISPAEATELSGVVKLYADALELGDLDRRLQALESRLAWRGDREVIADAE